MYHARIGHDPATAFFFEEPEQLDSDTAHTTAAGKQASDEHKPTSEASPTLLDSAAAEESSGQQASAPETGADEVEEVPRADEQPEGSASAVTPGQANALALIKKNNFEPGESMDVFGCLENIRQSFEFSMDRCSRCAGTMQLFKGQLKSKTSKILICDKCNRAATMLSRHVTWPPEEWSSLNNDMIRAFWQNAGSIQEDNKLEWRRLKVVLITALSQAIHHEKSSQVSENGKFLPLSWYAAQGYNTAAIEANTSPENKQFHTVLQETVFRVPIISISYSDIQQQVTTKMTNLEGARKMRMSKARKAIGDQSEAQELEDKTSPSANAIAAAKPSEVVISDSDSSSSSSSDKKKKKKKSKKHKRGKHDGAGEGSAVPVPTEKELKLQQRKEEREKERQRKQAVAECRKHNSSVCALATRAFPSLKKAVENAERCLKDPQCSQIHKGSVDKLSKHYDEVKAWRDEASDVLTKAKTFSEKDRRLPEMTFTRDSAAKGIATLEETACALQKMITIVSSC